MVAQIEEGIADNADVKARKASGGVDAQVYEARMRPKVY
jgi:hypothetical protein